MIVANVRGGLGNQLFMYAFGRSLSIAAGVPLALDCTSGFKKDHFARHFDLEHFMIEAKRAKRPTASQLSFLISKLPFQLRSSWELSCGLLVERGKPTDYDAALVHSASRISDLHSFGYWQNELYFKPHETQIRHDLQIVPPEDEQNKLLSEMILNSKAVCLHARRLHNITSVRTNKPKPTVKPLPVDYYQNCLARISSEHPDAHIFCFADDPEWLRQELRTALPLTFVTNNQSPKKSYADLWLMSLCKHFIVANSTFSWWAAWLGRSAGQTVYCPHPLDYFGCAEPAAGWTVVRC